MTRNTLTTLVVASLLVVSMVGAPVMAASTPAVYEDKLSPAAADVPGLFGADTSGLTTYDGRPGVYVTFEEDAFGSLESWADSDESRDIIATDNGSSRALVAAPAPEIFGGFHFDETTIAGQSVPVPSRPTGLVAAAYVEHVDVALRVSRTDPVTSLDGEDSFSPPRYATFAGAGDGFTTDGVAYAEDTTEATPAEIRAAINADGVSATGAGVTVAVIDTGLNINSLSNDDLYQDRLKSPKNTITDGTGAASTATSNEHGPWVTGVLAADPDPNTTGEAYEGVAPNATVVPIKGLADDGSGNTQDIVEGIEHASRKDADILSLSLGSPTYSATIASELREFLDDGGTAVFLAVGNSRQRPGHLRYVASPADVPAAGVVSVAATNTTTAANASSAYFSNVGPDSGVSDFSNGVTNGAAPDLAAPGMNVSAPYLDSNGLRANSTLSGTSMSTPVAAGVGALVLEANPDLRNESREFEKVMNDSAVAMPNAAVSEVGHGMVDAANATATVDVERDQEEAMTETAERRDTANEAYSGSRLVRLALGIRGGVA